MVENESLILGESRRTVDERYRLTIPQEFVTPLGGEQSACILAKERAGCISLWNRARFRKHSTLGWR